LIAFPIFKRLQVLDYGLYPGTPAGAGLDFTFEPGLSLVLGANGLGKTTLVNLLHRMCTGPYALPGRNDDSPLGGQNLRKVNLPPRERRVFAQRVNDDAKAAEASLEFRLGDVELKVRRALNSLGLINLVVDGEELDPEDAAFENAVIRAAGLYSFADWVLVLRYLVFYFEDRRALIWDPTAQLQLHRLLFLPPRTAGNWSKRQRKILELDSEARNLRNVLNRTRATLGESEKALVEGATVRDELLTLENLQKVDWPKLSELTEKLANLESELQRVRLSKLKAEQGHESALRYLERHQLGALIDAFPDADDTAQYLVGKLISEGRCLTCGNRTPSAVKTLKKRLADEHCVVCNADLSGPTDSVLSAPSPQALGQAETALARAAERLDATRETQRELEESVAQARERRQEMNTKIAVRSARINTLIAKLPPEEAEVHETRSELAGLSVEYERLQAEAGGLRDSFAHSLAQMSRKVLVHSEQVRRAFAQFAEGFLLDECSLVWEPYEMQIGQDGRTFNFPAFEVEMAGSDLPSPVRRSGPTEASESQREFIDLAFRMALMQVAGEDGTGSLVIDAPESSLDAVFASHAAAVLARFSEIPENRLVVTSNVIEGDLLPGLCRAAEIKSQSDPHLLNLFAVAAPTKATKEHSAEYTEALGALFAS